MFHQVRHTLLLGRKSKVVLRSLPGSFEFESGITPISSIPPFMVANFTMADHLSTSEEGDEDCSQIFEADDTCGYESIELFDSPSSDVLFIKNTTSMDVHVPLAKRPIPDQWSCPHCDQVLLYKTYRAHK